MFKIKNLFISGAEVLPLIEGGKGIGASDGNSSGAWAKQGGVGTFSGVYASYCDNNGERVPLVFNGSTRRERQNELVEQAIKGGVYQARVAHEVSCGNGRIHMNVLWEMGAVEQILKGIFEKAKGLIHGVTCGAGMPFKLADICSSYKVYFYPIVSSARAFKILWKRSYHKFSEWLGGVVYEDPWHAGGHNGITNSESPEKPQRAYSRVLEIRNAMKDFKIDYIPIFMAGGVWCLNEWSDFIDNPELGPIAFQFGTRPMVTKESPIPMSWKKKLLAVKKGDIKLNRFSPTGFYSSALNNNFLQNLYAKSERQISYSSEPSETFTEMLNIGKRGRTVFIKSEDIILTKIWAQNGFDTALKTPDSTLVFVTRNQSLEILKDQSGCIGCLSACKFSNWSQIDEKPFNRSDPRSFCIQKALQNSINDIDIENNLLFAGTQAYRFSKDSLYKDGYIPSVQELMDRIRSGY